jgi:hypothetical protein
MNKQTLYFAVYINISGQSRQKARESIAQIKEMYKTSDSEEYKQQYEEKIFFLPVKQGDSRMELLYPAPFLTAEQSKDLYDKYYEKFQDLIENIKEL